VSFVDGSVEFKTGFECVGAVFGEVSSIVNSCADHPELLNSIKPEAFAVSVVREVPALIF
jgi:hypothetical protein